MIILAIETSCDETAISIIKTTRKKHEFQILSNKILSQIDLHKDYGGVFPALAKREHAKAIIQLIAEALHESGLLKEKVKISQISQDLDDKLKSILFRELDVYKAIKIMFESLHVPKIDYIAVTTGPGLEPSLWVGVNTAKALGLFWNIPIYAINHMEGHILSSLIKKKDSFRYELIIPKSPSIALLISGGHTEIIRFTKLHEYKLLGATRDDAVGEAFDKTARMLGLKYPGGPEISKLAERARQDRFIVSAEYRLPRPMLNSHDYDFSFSGLKTAVLYMLKKFEILNEIVLQQVALEFENAVTDVLHSKTKKAIFETGSKSLILGGGVSANKNIRKSMTSLAEEMGIDLYLPDPKHTTDNALMIAVTALMKIENGLLPNNLQEIKADGNLSLV